MADFDYDPDECPQPNVRRFPREFDEETHQRCFDYAMAVVAAGGDLSRVPEVSPTKH